MSNARLYPLGAESLTVGELARRAAMSTATLKQRLSKGMSPEEIVRQGARKRHTYTLNGKPTSLLDLERITGLSANTVNRRLLAGATPEEIVADPRTVLGKLSMDGKPATVREVAARAGISTPAVANRLKAGLTVEEIVRQGKRRFRDLDKMLRLDGQVISARDLAVKAGVNVGVVRERLDAGLTPEQIIAAPRWWQGLLLDGKPVSTEGIAKAAGVSVATVRKDLQAGLTPEDIVRRGANRRGTTLNVLGQKLTIGDAAALGDIPTSTIKMRLRAGWDEAEAVLTPTRGKGTKTPTKAASKPKRRRKSSPV